MIRVGQLVARELVDGPQDLPSPFRFSRYDTGDPRPTNHPPFPQR